MVAMDSIQPPIGPASPSYCKSISFCGSDHFHGDFYRNVNMFFCNKHCAWHPIVCPQSHRPFVLIIIVVTAINSLSQSSNHKSPSSLMSSGCRISTSIVKQPRQCVVGVSPYKLPQSTSPAHRPRIMLWSGRCLSRLGDKYLIGEVQGHIWG